MCGPLMFITLKYKVHAMRLNTNFIKQVFHAASAQFTFWLTYNYVSTLNGIKLYFTLIVSRVSQRVLAF